MKSNRLLAIVLTCLLTDAATSPADESDDTLRFYLSKSDLVVTGHIASEPAGITHELGVVNYPVQFAVAGVIKGDTGLTGKTVSVNIVRFELNDADRSPLLRKNGHCLLFLKPAAPDTPAWQTADMWFGIQTASPWLTRSLKRVATEMSDRTNDFFFQNRKRDDTVTAKAKQDNVVIDIVSPSGIGGTSITRKTATWPDRMILRFHLAGLENVSVTANTLTLSASVLSHGEFTKHVHWTPDHLEALDPGLLRTFTADGKPTDKLPGKGGWFELTIPQRMFDQAGDKLEINWIDFYR